MKRVHVFYTGNVQGVGFRLTAESVALDLKVKGWVKNLHNGQVEIVAEQQEEVLKEMLKRLHQFFSRYIHNTDIEWLEATDEFQDFRVQF